PAVSRSGRRQHGNPPNRLPLPPARRYAPAGGFFVPRCYSLVTEGGYVPAHDDRPDGAGGSPRAALARAPGHQPGRPAVSRRAHGAGPAAAAPAPRARLGAGGQRVAGDPSLRPLLRVDLGVGPRGGHLRGSADDLRHAGVLAPGARYRGPARAGRGDLSDGVRAQVAAAAGGIPGGAAGGDPERGVRAVGDLRVDPVPAHRGRAAAPGRARLDAVPERRVLRELAARGVGDSRHHDRAVYRRGLARGALGRPGQSARGGAGDGRHALGSGVDRGGPVRTGGADRRRDPRPGACAGRNDGGDHAHRQPPRHRAVGAATRLHHGRGDRQRIQRSHDRSVSVGAVRGRADPVRRHGGRERHGAALDLARRPRHGGGESRPVNARRWRRRLTSGGMTGLVALLSFLAVLALVLILGDLVVRGASSLDWGFFTKNPVPAGESGGGVANAIVGTAIIVGLAGLIGLPIGIGTGLYLAEYRSGRLGWVVRFVADVLNGTPSIVVGIFAWTWLVKPMGHFSALAGSVALAVLMVPMLARTTEEIVRLVPHSLREAALALGYPRWRTSLRVIARTALAGIVTGCLVG